MSEDMIHINLDSLIYSSVERNIIDELFKVEFYKEVKNFGLDFEKLFINNRKSNKSMMEEFNHMLKKFKKDFYFDISDMIICLEQDFSNINSIISLLDGESMYILKDELSEKFNIELEKNCLSAFMEE